MKTALIQWGRSWREATVEENIDRGFKLLTVAVVVLLGPVLLWKIGAWVYADGNSALMSERSIAAVLALVAFAGIGAPEDWLQKWWTPRALPARVLRALISGLVGGAGCGMLVALTAIYLAEPAGNKETARLLAIGFGVCFVPFFIAGDWKRSLATIEQSRGDVLATAIVRGAMFATIAFLAVLGAEGLIGWAIGADKWRFATLLGVRFFEFLAAAAVGVGIGTRIYRTDAPRSQATVTSYSWSDVERGRWLTSRFIKIPARLSVEAVGDDFLIRHRQMPRNRWTLGTLRIALALAVTLFVGHGLMPIVEIIETLVGLRGIVSGAVNMVGIWWLGNLLAVPEDVTFVVPWLIVLVLVYRLAWWTIAMRWPGTTMTLGHWADLSSFSVAPRADHYGGGGIEARPPKGAVLLANFSNGSSYRVADSEAAAVTIHDLHTLLTALFIDGRARFFANLKVAQREKAHAAGEPAKII